MDGVVLAEIESEKDLGVYITKESKPSTQCTKAAQKAMNSTRVIKKTFKYFDHDAFQTLYRTYIRPHLEYCVPAWNPGMKKDIKVLEKVLRRATKLVPELRDMSYKERLDALDLYTLETRRLRCDLIETYYTALNPVFSTNVVCAQSVSKLSKNMLVSNIMIKPNNSTISLKI